MILAVMNTIIDDNGWRYISNNLSRDVRESKYFSILADEANREDLSVAIRFVDAEKNIREEFGDYEYNIWPRPPIVHMVDR